MIPVEEMLAELQTALEVFAIDPTDDNFARVQAETSRIDRECENILVEMED